MAEVTEIFKGVVDVQVSGVDNAIKSLNNLLDVVTKIQKIGDVKVKVDVDDSRLQSFRNRVNELNTLIGKSGSLAGRGQFRNSIRDMEAFAVTFRDTFRDMKSTADDSATQAAAIIGTSTDEIVKLFKRLEKAGSPVFDSLVDSAQSAADKIVFKSIIPDMVNDIEQEFRLLPPTFATVTKEMQQDFIDLKNQFRQGVVDDDFVKTKDAANKLDLLRKNLADLGDLSRTVSSGTGNVELAKQLGVNDALFEIESGVRRLKDKTSPEVLAFREDLIKVRAAFRDLGRDGGTTVTEVANSVIKLSEAFRSIQDADIANSLAESLQQAENKLSASTSKQKDRIDELAQRIESIRVAGEKPIDGLAKSFDFLSEATGQDLSRVESSIRRTQEVMEGFSLAISTPGARLQGLREIIAGTGQSSNILVKGLDALISRGNTLDKSNDKFIKSASQIALNVTEVTSSLKNQFNQFRLLNQAELGNVNASEELSKTLTKVEASFRQLATTAQSGGDITRSLAGSQNAVRDLEREFKTLVESGLLPAGSKSAEVFKSIIQQAKNAESGVQAIGVRYNASKRDAEQFSESVGKSSGIFGRLRSSALSFFGVFSKGQGDVRQTSSAIKAIESSVKSLGSATLSLKDIFVGTFAGTFAANITEPLINTIEDAVRFIPGAIVGLASRSEESLSRFRFEFGDTADQVEEDLGVAAQAMGRFQLDLEEFGADFQGLFGTIGLDPSQAADFSKQMSILTSDLASFFNTADDEAAAALRSALVGESEPIRKYNVLLSEAAVGQELLALGFQGSTKDATEQQKVLARASLIFKQTTTAQGDAVRTSESWANQTRRLNAQFQQFGQDIGGVVLPALAPFIQIINDIAATIFPFLVQKVTEVSASLREIAVSMADTVNAVLGGNVDLESNFSTFVGAIVSLISGDWQSAMQLLFLSVDDAIANVGSLLADFVSSGFDWGFGFMSELGNGIIEAAGQVLEAVIDIINTIADYLAPGSPPKKGPLSQIDKWGSGIMTVWSDSLSDGFDAGFLADLLDPIAETLGDKFQDEAIPKFQSIRDELSKIIEGIDQAAVIDEDAFKRIADTLGDDEATKRLREQLEARQKLSSASKRVADAEAKVRSEAESGFISAESKQELQNAREALDLAQQEQEQVDDRQKAIDRINNLEEELAKTKEESSKISATGAAVASDAAVKGLKKERETALDRYNTELDLIEQRYSAGELTEEQYLKAKISADEKWLKSTENTDKEATIAKLAENKKRLKDLQDTIKAEDKARKDSLKEQSKAAKEAAQELAKGQILDFEAPDLFGNILGKGGTNEVKNFGEDLKKNISKAFSDASQSVQGDIQKLIDSVIGKFTEFGTKAKASISTSFQNAFAPVINVFKTGIDNTKAIIAGLGLSLPIILIGPVRSAITALSGLSGPIKAVGSVFKSVFGVLFPTASSVISSLSTGVRFLATGIFPKLITGFNTIIKVTGPTALKFSLIGTAVAALIYGISTNIDTLVGIFDDAFNRISGIISRIVSIVLDLFGVFSGEGSQAITPFTVLLGILSKALEFLNSVVQSVLPNVTQFFKGAFETIYGIIQSTIFPGINLIIGLLALFVGDSTVASESFLAAFEAIKSGLPNIVEGIFNIFASLITFSANLFTGIVTSFFNIFGLPEVGQALTQGARGLVNSIQSAFSLLGQIITGILKGQINIESIFSALGLDSLGEFITGQFSETFLQLSLTFDQLISVIQDQILPIFSLVFSQISEVVSQSIALILERLNSLAPIWDFIVIQLKQLGISFDGDFNLIQGIVVGVVGTIVAIFTTLAGIVVSVINGIAVGLEVAVKAFEYLSSGISTVFAGIFTVLNGFIEFFTGIFTLDFESALSGAIAIFSGFGDIISGLFDVVIGIVGASVGVILGFIAGFVEEFIIYFVNLYNELVGNSIIPDLVNDVVAYVATLPGQLIEIISGMVTTLVDKALELGTSFINALKEGLSLGGIGETIAGLFSGGAEGATGAGGGFLSQIFGGGETSGVALQETNAQFTQFSLFFQETVTLMAGIWNLFINEAFLFGWTNAILLITESLTIFNVFFQTIILGFQIQWQLFMQQVVSVFIQSVATMQEVFTSFINTAIELVMALIAVIEELIKTFEKAASAAKEMGDTIVESSKDAKDALNEMKPVVEQLIKLFEKLEAAAKRAANAARDVGSASSGGAPSAQGGAYRTYEGMWHLHDDEMVLPEPIASGFRNLLGLLTSSGIHGVSLAALPTGNPRPLSTDAISSGANLPQITFENHIYNDMDVNRLNQQIIDTVTRLI